MIYLLGDSPALRGHAQSIARGITDRDNDGGPELLLNPDPTFEWVRLAQRIPVRIHIDNVPNGVLISSGMTCTVVLEAPPRQWAALAVLSKWRAASRERFKENKSRVASARYYEASVETACGLRWQQMDGGRLPPTSL